MTMNEYTDLFTGETLTAEQLVERYNPGRIETDTTSQVEWARLTMSSSFYRDA